LSDADQADLLMPRKAMVLAAGFGKRLQPLTHVVPKPLVPVAGVPLIRFALRLLARNGVEEVMINLHHLPDVVEAELGRRSEGLRLSYSREASILGTGGGIRKVSSFFDETFVVVNADAMLDVDLAPALEIHRALEAIATMVVRPHRKDDPFSVVGVDEGGQVRQIADRVRYEGPPLTPHVFTGVHILEPEFLDYIPPDIESCINSYAYRKVLEDQRVVAAHVYNGFWAVVGTLERYWQVNADFLRRRIQLRDFDPLDEIGAAPRKDVDDVIRLGDKCTLGAGVRLEPPVVVASGARIADGAEVGPEVVVGSGVIIGKNAKVARSVLLSGAKIEAGAVVKDEIVTRKFRVPLNTQS